jgi:hypothetical protein
MCDITASPMGELKVYGTISVRLSTNICVSTFPEVYGTILEFVSVF